MGCLQEAAAPQSHCPCLTEGSCLTSAHDVLCVGCLQETSGLCLLERPRLLAKPCQPVWCACRTVRPPDDDGFACFELLGYDILLDHKCRPWLLEVNHSPSFCTDSALDLQVKQHLILDTLALVRGGAGKPLAEFLGSSMLCP